MKQIDAYFRAKLSLEMGGHVFGTINRTVLTSGASESYLQVGEAAAYVFFDGCVDQSVTMAQEGKNLSVVFKKGLDGGVASVKIFIWFVAPGIMNCAAVENKAAAVTRRVNGESATI